MLVALRYEAHAVNADINIQIDSHEHMRRVCLALASSVNQNARANSIKYTRIFSLLFSPFCSARRLVPFWPLPICHLSHFRYPNVIFFYCKTDLWLLVGLRLCPIPLDPYIISFSPLCTYSFSMFCLCIRFILNFFFLLFGFIIFFSL